MRTTAALKATALIAIAVLMALLTVQGTLALWNATASSKNQTVQSADFAVTVRTPDGGTARLSGTQTISVGGLTGLTPGTSRTVPVQVTNATDAGNGTFKARITAGTPQVSGTLAGYLTASIRPAQSTDCSSVRTGTSIDLAQNATGVFCLTAALSANAPATLGGTTGAVTITLTAQQL